MKTDYTAVVNGEHRTVTVESADERTFTVRIGETELVVEAQPVGATGYQLRVGDAVHDLVIERGSKGTVVVHAPDGATTVTLLDERQLARQAVEGGLARRHAHGLVPLPAPMPGKIVKYLVRAGEEVTVGQGLVVVEAMKMENELRSVVDGTVKQLGAPEGQSVEAGVDLMVIEARPDGPRAAVDDNGA